MPCTCDFALLERPISGRDYSDELGKFPTLALNFELTNELSRRTSGNRFFYCSLDRIGDCIDPCGVTLIPPESQKSLADALSGLGEANITGYERKFDDSPYPLDEQLERLSRLLADAHASGAWLICFGA